MTATARSYPRLARNEAHDLIDDMEAPVSQCSGLIAALQIMCSRIESGAQREAFSALADTLASEADKIALLREKVWGGTHPCHDR